MEDDLNQKYGKGLKMLMKMGGKVGYEVGKGVGKNH
jgi:hypothetical protein